MSKVFQLNVVVEGKSPNPHVIIKPVRLSGLFSTENKKANEEHVAEYVKSDIKKHYLQGNKDIELTVRITAIKKLKTDFLLFEKQ